MFNQDIIFNTFIFKHLTSMHFKYKKKFQLRVTNDVFLHLNGIKYIPCLLLHFFFLFFFRYFILL